MPGSAGYELKYRLHNLIKVTGRIFPVLMPENSSDASVSYQSSFSRSSSWARQLFISNLDIALLPWRFQFSSLWPVDGNAPGGFCYCSQQMTLDAACSWCVSCKVEPRDLPSGMKRWGRFLCHFPRVERQKFDDCSTTLYSEWAKNELMR